MMPIGLDSLEGIARRLLTCLRAPLSSDDELVCEDKHDPIPNGEFDYVPKDKWVAGPADRFPLVPRLTLLPGRERTSEAGRG